MFHADDDYVDINGNQVKATDSTAIHQFVAYSSNFSGVSGSIGATYQLPKGFYVKANLSHGFRAPNVAESGSNGVHDGTVVYEYGTSILHPETSTQIDFALGINTKDIGAEINVFGNFINNYIYPKQLYSILGGDSIVNNVPGYPSAPAFRYTQGNATLWGGEVAIDIHPRAVKWFDLYAGYSIVNAGLNNQPDSTKNLPFIPPGKLRVELTLKLKKLSNALSKPFIRLGMNYTFSQTHLYYQTQIYYALPAGTPEANASISSSAAYGLFNAAIGSDIMYQNNKICTLVFSCDNIFDVAYLDYMSRFKYYPINGTTNRVGVYNMGRNFSFKVLLPLTFKK
jgi:iron complex outermembrane receptor protein